MQFQKINKKTEKVGMSNTHDTICAFLKGERYLMPFYYKAKFFFVLCFLVYILFAYVHTVMPFKRLNYLASSNRNIMLDKCLKALTPKAYASTVNKMIKLIVDVLSSDFFFLFIR